MTELSVLHTKETNDAECFFCTDEWTTFIQKQGYELAYKHGHLPVCEACKERFKEDSKPMTELRDNNG